MLIKIAGFLAFAFLLAGVSPAPGTQIVAVRATAVSATEARVVVVLNAAVHAGWQLSGGGTTDVALLLPGATGTLAQLPPLQANKLLTGYDVTPNGSELYVTFHLKKPVTATATASGPAITIDFHVLGEGAMAARPSGGKTTLAASPEHTFEVIRLKYADVSEVAGVLTQGSQIQPNDVFQAQGSIFSLPTSANGTQPLQSQQTYGAQPSTPQSFGEKVSDNVAIDRRLNAVILTGTRQQIESLRLLVQAIDVPLDSVMLQCQVVELSETAARDLGLELATGAGAPIASGGLNAASGQLPTFSANIQASLFATIAKGGGRILATPQVLALSGMPAQILTGDALPIIQTTIFPGSPTLTQVSTNYIAVGVNLQIQPRITRDGFVTSHIFAEVSSVTAYVPTTQGNVPQISLRQATTSATVQDGTPFIIGGLLRDEEIDNLSKIPGLGDLPLIGGIFRTRHDTSARSNLYVVITPHIIHTGTAPRR
ncbi:MAG TPA: secretin N-terminal domain-containing protein [Candidatus Baltobacteraceae bacterium]|jgi:general secretion pathway protein D|nr:secretin N-terminal domain-containing protein [Candidatus Baltobacteraceae bacterium]